MKRMLDEITGALFEPVPFLNDYPIGNLHCFYRNCLSSHATFVWYLTICKALYGGRPVGSTETFVTGWEPRLCFKAKLAATWCTPRNVDAPAAQKGHLRSRRGIHSLDGMQCWCRVGDDQPTATTSSAYSAWYGARRHMLCLAPRHAVPGMSAKPLNAWLPPCTHDIESCAISVKAGARKAGSPAPTPHRCRRPWPHIPIVLWESMTTDRCGRALRRWTSAPAVLLLVLLLAAPLPARWERWALGCAACVSSLGQGMSTGMACIRCRCSRALRQQGGTCPDLVPGGDCLTAEVPAGGTATLAAYADVGPVYVAAEALVGAAAHSVGLFAPWAPAAG
jgi:hypothetical protein